MKFSNVDFRWSLISMWKRQKWIRFSVVRHRGSTSLDCSFSLRIAWPSWSPDRNIISNHDSFLSANVYWFEVTPCHLQHTSSLHALDASDPVGISTASEWNALRVAKSIQSWNIHCSEKNPWNIHAFLSQEPPSYWCFQIFRRFRHRFTIVDLAGKPWASNGIWSLQFTGLA